MIPALVDSLRSIVGAEHVLTGVDLSPYVVEGRTPEATVFPGSLDEVAAVVRCGAGAGVPIVPWGGGTAASVGAPSERAGLVLGLTRLRSLVAHEPGDLTATVQAGMTVTALQAALRARGQWLSLDPPDADRATVGGMLAADAAGPRRHLYGTSRDVLIGLTIVSADGAVVRGGGKVVKNVAGYDLPKLFIGSYGTLGVIVDATFKLRPLPDDERLVAVPFGNLKDAGAAVRALMASDLTPCAVDLLDAVAADSLGLQAAAATLVIGFDGLGEQVAWQVSQLAAVVGAGVGGEPTTLSPAVWARLPSAARDAFEAPAAVMTLSVLPTLVAETVEQCASAARARGLASAWTAHAGVGRVVGALATSAEARERDGETVAAVLSDWRTAARGGGGHACVTWAPLSVKAALPVWDDAGAAGRIMRRIKAQLDPHNVLHPGRFVAGI